MTLLPNDFKEFLLALNHCDVEYMLIGGYAVTFYGYPRTTADIDIWISTKPKNAARVMNALRDFGFGNSDANEQMFLATGRVIRMGVPPLRIEILTSISGVEFDACYSRCTQAVLDDVPVKIISQPDLIANKLAAGRPKDIADVAELE